MRSEWGYIEEVEYEYERHVPQRQWGSFTIYAMLNPARMAGRRA
jgi:hypothetical protein